MHRCRLSLSVKSASLNSTVYSCFMKLWHGISITYKTAFYRYICDYWLYTTVLYLNARIFTMSLLLDVHVRAFWRDENDFKVKYVLLMTPWLDNEGTCATWAHTWPGLSCIITGILGSCTCDIGCGLRIVFQLSCEYVRLASKEEQLTNIDIINLMST